MKILVISDLHANGPALEAVLAAESFDRLVVAGDLVSYGPHPREVVNVARSRATVVVQGNHDAALARGIDCRCAPSSKPLAEATRAVHRTLLPSEDLRFLAGLPRTASFSDGARTFFVVHASPRNHLYRYTLTPDAPAEHLRKQLGSVAADYVLLGHTHLPMARRVGARTVVNPGSVGQPRDGDPRASYAVIDDGAVTLKRVRYDIDRTIRGLSALPLAPAVVRSLVAILRTGRG